MSRIDKKFKELKKDGKKALVIFLTAGDPDLKKNEELIYAMEKDGVDLIELGIPFSDPLADGPVIQASSMRSLAKKTNLKKILELVSRVRKNSQIPILLMGYLNPILQYGYERLAKDARLAGVDGIIVPDVPPEEGGELAPIMKKNGIDVVYLLAPTSDASRRAIVSKASSGFIYYVSMTGVTGSKAAAMNDIHANIRLAKKGTRLPVCVGFGISSPEQAVEMGKTADGVIVGSHIVNALFKEPKLSAQAFSAKYVRPIAQALKKDR